MSNKGKQSICLINNQGTLVQNGEEVFPIYSITKVLIATTVLRLEIPLTTSIREWITPQWCPHTINIGQLLNHSSGLTDYGAQDEYQRAIKAGIPWTDRDFADRTLMRPLLFEPGSQFAYSNPGYWLLKKIIERETATTFDSALRMHVFEPFGMSSAYVAHNQFAEDLPWYPAEWVWHGLVMANAYDVAQFLRQLDAQLLTQNLIGVGEAPKPWQQPHYGNGLMIEPNRWFGHNGGGPGYSASTFHFVEEDVTGCVLQSVTDLDPSDPDPAMIELFRHVGEL